MSKKSRRRNKRILGALGALGALALATRRRNAAIDKGIQSAEDDKGSDMLPTPKTVKTPKNTVVSTPKTIMDSMPKRPKLNEKSIRVKDGKVFTIADAKKGIKPKRVGIDTPGILVRDDGRITAGGKQFLNKEQYASRNEKPAMLSDSMFYEGTPQNSEFDQMVFDSVYAKGGRVKKKPFAKRGFGRAYKRRK